MKAKNELKLRFTRGNDTKLKELVASFFAIFDHGIPEPYMNIFTHVLESAIREKGWFEEEPPSASSQEERPRPQGLAIPHVPDELLPAVRALV